MKTLNFSITINAPKKKVWSVMLEQESYRIWTSEFMAGSYYEGSWEEGARIRFLGPDGEGMTSMITASRPFDFISIKHLGLIKDGVEDTESPEVKAWAPAFENYSFIENNGVTELKVELDVAPKYEEYMERVWPKALTTLKSICEQVEHESASLVA